MFISKQALRDLIVEAVRSCEDYPVQLIKIKKELAELETRKVMEEREIKHLVKLKEEKLEIENQKKVLQLDKAYSDKLLELQKVYHEKQLADLHKAREEMKEVYNKIMERLPNITASLEVKGRR